MPDSQTLADDPVYAFTPSYDLPDQPQQIRIVFQDMDVGRSLEELRTELGDDLEHWERAGRRRIGFTRSTQLPFAPEGAAAGEFVDAVAWMRESLDRLVSTLHPRLQRMISARN